MEPGTHGKISSSIATDGRFVATTYYRDQDGKRRLIERGSRKSPEDARRLLHQAIRERHAPVSAGQIITDKTTVDALFRVWIERKERDVRPQTATLYRRAWTNHAQDQIGSLRIRELTTSRADRHILAVSETAPSEARLVRSALLGMYNLAAKFDVIAVNPIREASQPPASNKEPRAITPDEFARVRTVVAAHVKVEGRSGPPAGRLLPAFVEVLQATGQRPGEVLALRWQDVDLLGDPPTITVAGTVIDHGRIPGKPVHRQDYRKTGKPHTVQLPDFGVEALTELYGITGAGASPDDPVFANRDGGWSSLANLRRVLRAALPEDLRWITPHSFRRSVATIVRDAHGIEAAQAQASHSRIETTERHYAERRTWGPDVRQALDRFEQAAKVQDRL